jgi:catalase
VGRMVLDRNPANFFAEVEQAAFSPANLVPGIGLSPDRMLMGRVFSYHDTHLYRVGTNYEQLPINAPKVEVHSYNKEGAMTFHHAGDQPVYAPNSYGGPVADPDRAGQVTWDVASGELGRFSYDKHAEDDDFGQAGSLVRNVFSDVDREHLVTNIVGHASDQVSEEVQRRVVVYWTSVDPDVGERVASGLGVDPTKLQEATDIVAAHANQA